MNRDCNFGTESAMVDESVWGIVDRDRKGLGDSQLQLDRNFLNLVYSFIYCILWLS